MQTFFSTRTGTRRWRIIVIGMLLVAGTLLMAACNDVEGTSGIEIGMLETSSFNQTEARFMTFSGRKGWREDVQAGETLILDYTVEATKGSLTLQVENPSGDVVWETVLGEGESVNDRAEFVAEVAGQFTVRVLGDGAGGSYALSWDVD